MAETRFLDEQGLNTFWQCALGKLRSSDVYKVQEKICYIDEYYDGASASPVREYWLCTLWSNGRVELKYTSQPVNMNFSKSGSILPYHDCKSRHFPINQSLGFAEPPRIVASAGATSSWVFVTLPLKQNSKSPTDAAYTTCIRTGTFGLFSAKAGDAINHNAFFSMIVDGKLPAGTDLSRDDIFEDKIEGEYKYATY